MQIFFAICHETVYLDEEAIFFLETWWVLRAHDKNELLTDKDGNGEDLYASSPLPLHL